MEPTESAAAGSRLRLRRMAGAWHASRWFGRRDGGAPSPAADARGCAPPATARASAPPPTGRGGPPASHTGQDSAPPPTGQGAPRSSTGHVSAPSATGHTPAASTTGPVPTRPAGGRGPASRAPGRGPRGRIPGPGAAPSRPGPAPVGTDADGERHLPWPALPSAVVAAASFVLGAGFYRAFTDGQALFPSGTAGWALAVLTGIVVGHLVMLGRSRWWGGTGSGAALTLAVLLLYGWVPAGMVSLTVVVLVGIARRGRWRHGVLHGAVDILGIAAGATLLGVCGSVPSVEEPWDPATWGVYAAPKVVLVAVAYLAVTRALLWYLQTPRAGLPTVARTALVRQGLVAVALLGIAPLVCVVAVAKPLLLPLFAIPLIALDSTLWIARARAEEQLRDPLTGLPNRSGCWSGPGPRWTTRSASVPAPP